MPFHEKKTNSYQFARHILSPFTLYCRELGVESKKSPSEWIQMHAQQGLVRKSGALFATLNIFEDACFPLL